MPRVPDLTESQLRQRHSAKWTSFDADVIPMPVAEMDFELAPPIKAKLIEMINRGDTGYVGKSPIGSAFSGFAARHWNWEVDPTQVTTATDVGVAGVELLRIVANQGNVVVNTPVYHNFFNWLREAKCEMVDVPLNASDWSLDLAGLRAAFAAGAKTFILCHPHNPVGAVFSAEQLRAVADLAAEFGVTVISDEVWAPLTFDDSQFTPYLAVSENARKTGIAITAASKSWNVAGLKCALIITADADMADQVRKLPINVPWRPSLFGLWATVTAFSEGDEWLASVKENLEANRKLLADLLATHLPKARYEIPPSTYLGWVDLRAYIEKDAGKLLTEKARVAFNDGGEFGASGAGWVRINFGTSPELLTEAILRVAKVLAD